MSQEKWRNPNLKALPKAYFHESELRGDDLLDLVEMAQQGDAEARNKIIMRGMRLITAIASKYRPIAKSMSLQDIVHEGVFGLNEALKRFDPDKGDFYEYVAVGIRRSIQRAVMNTSRTIRFPVRTEILMGKIRRLSASNLNRAGQPLPAEEIASKLDLKVGEVSNALSAMDMGETFSLDAPALPYENGSAPMIDFVPDQSDEADTELSSDPILKSRVDKAAESLSDRERRILILRSRGASLQVIADKFELKRNRINVLERNANSKLNMAITQRSAPAR